MGSFKARKSQCLEASHRAKPFTTLNQHPPVVPSWDIDRPSPGRAG
jgi:hypothetical protein